MDNRLHSPKKCNIGITKNNRDRTLTAVTAQVYKAIFDSVFYQKRLYTKSMTRRSIIEEFWRGEGLA